MDAGRSRQPAVSDSELRRLILRYNSVLGDSESVTLVSAHGRPTKFADIQYKGRFTGINACPHFFDLNIN